MAWSYGDKFEFDLKKDYIDIKKGHYTLTAIGFGPFGIEFRYNGKSIYIPHDSMDNLRETTGKSRYGKDKSYNSDYQSFYDDEYPSHSHRSHYDDEYPW